MTTIPDEILANIVKSPLEEQWIILKVLEAENEVEHIKQRVKQIKEGVNLKFDLNAVLHGRTHERPKNMTISINRQEYDLEEYEDEMDLRHRLATEIILEAMEPGSSIRGPDTEAD